MRARPDYQKVVRTRLLRAVGATHSAIADPPYPSCDNGFIFNASLDPQYPSCGNSQLSLLL